MDVAAFAAECVADLLTDDVHADLFTDNWCLSLPKPMKLFSALSPSSTSAQNGISV